EREPVRLTQVQGNGALAAVARQIVGGCLGVEERGAPGAGVVSGAGALDLDDTGPQVGEELAAERPGEDAGGVEDAQAGEGGVHTKSPASGAAWTARSCPSTIIIGLRTRRRRDSSCFRGPPYLESASALRTTVLTNEHPGSRRGMTSSTIVRL